MNFLSTKNCLNQDFPDRNSPAVDESQKAMEMEETSFKEEQTMIFMERSVTSAQWTDWISSTENGNKSKIRNNASYNAWVNIHGNVHSYHCVSVFVNLFPIFFIAIVAEVLKQYLWKILSQYLQSKFVEIIVAKFYFSAFGKMFSNICGLVIHKFYIVLLIFTMVRITWWATPSKNIPYEISFPYVLSCYFLL